MTYLANFLIKGEKFSIDIAFLVGTIQSYQEILSLQRNAS